MDPWLRGLTIGAAYLAVIRAKFTAFEMGGKPVPFGFELVYEGAKSFVHKRINRIAKAACYAETIELAQKSTLAELATRARLATQQDALLTDEPKRALDEWQEKVVAGAKTGDERLGRSSLADFILSGQAGSRAKT